MDALCQRRSCFLCSRWPARRPKAERGPDAASLRGLCTRARVHTGASARQFEKLRARACAAASASCARLRPSAPRARSACVRASARRSRPSSASAAAAARSRPTRSARMFSAASAARSRSRAPASAPAPAAAPAARAWAGAQPAQGFSRGPGPRARPVCSRRRRPPLFPPRAPDIRRRRLTQPAGTLEGMYRLCAAESALQGSCRRADGSGPVMSGDQDLGSHRLSLFLAGKEAIACLFCRPPSDS